MAQNYVELHFIFYAPFIKSDFVHIYNKLFDFLQTVDSTGYGSFDFLCLQLGSEDSHSVPLMD